MSEAPSVANCASHNAKSCVTLRNFRRTQVGDNLISV